AGQTYTGEGVAWFDLETGDQGQQFVDFNFQQRFKLPAVIHHLQFDPQGRLVVSTEGGIYRGLIQGFTYDTTSGGAGIAALEGFATPNQPGMNFSNLNGNLQIADVLSVANDAYIRGQIDASQTSIGFTQTASSLAWSSTNDIFSTRGFDAFANTAMY